MTWLNQIKIIDPWTAFAIMYNKGMQLQSYQKHRLIRIWEDKIQMYMKMSDFRQSFCLMCILTKSTNID